MFGCIVYVSETISFLLDFYLQVNLFLPLYCQCHLQDVGTGFQCGVMNSCFWICSCHYSRSICRVLGASGNTIFFYSLCFAYTFSVHMSAVLPKLAVAKLVILAIWLIGLSIILNKGHFCRVKEFMHNFKFQILFIWNMNLLWADGEFHLVL